MTGDGIFTCHEDGLWDTDSKCVINVCGSLPSIENAYNVSIDKTDHNDVGATATVICNTGYIVVGEQLECLDTGEWSTAPMCTIQGKGDHILNFTIDYIITFASFTLLMATEEMKSILYYHFDEKH